MYSLIYYCSRNQSLGFELEANILTKMVDFTLKCYLTSSLTPQAFIFQSIYLFLSFSFSVWRLYFFFILQQIWLVIEKIHGMGKESYFLESLMGLFFKVLLAKRRIRDRYCKIELTIWIIFIYECLQFFFHHSLFILLGPPN